MKLLREFKPALFFLAKFLGIYILGNIAYGFYIESYYPTADPATLLVTQQTSWCINLTGAQTSAEELAFKPSVAIVENGASAVNVFEGCNGLNVMIIFLAFVVAFGGPGKAMLWFLPSGLLIIHFVNLLRIGLLHFVAQHYASYFYYIHKYFFTAILYVVIFALWAIWVTWLSTRKAV